MHNIHLWNVCFRRYLPIIFAANKEKLSGQFFLHTAVVTFWASIDSDAGHDSCLLKFGFSEKATKFEKKSSSYFWQERRVLFAQQRTCQKVDEDFFLKNVGKL